ncbi:hypothetical protein [Pseudonocardia sp. McavD-2-B]|uniref:hypothetical protein n=1 Tax=Pseudonocardia sp. McavD-2-B TaxID=2954499 RepID=UPI0020976AE5|nr:hypothetical protein [Pseudonocardia sp. McavD-2-B]MCO7192305.1 hypothetical protein [Pseudonocardia sp. McavD-2-B]
MSAPQTRARRRDELVARSTRFGFFKRSETEGYVKCPARCGVEVAATVSLREQVGKRNPDAVIVKAIRAAVREHLRDDCPFAGVAT